MSESERPDARRDDSDESPRIKVTDRRLFDRDGNLRDDAVREPTAETPVEMPPPAERPSADRPVADARRPEEARRPATDDRSGDRGPTAGPSSPQTPPAGPAGRAAGRVSEADLRAGMDADLEGAGTATGPDGSARELPRDFAAFVESQYYEALLFLGAMPHPATGQTVEDLDMARYKIDVLGMLQEKTQGNLEPEEAQMLEEVLYQLRMSYLQKRKVARL